MSREYRLYLDNIRSACGKMVRHTHGMDLDALVGDDKTFEAMARNLEIIGEAAKHIPPEVRAHSPRSCGTKSLRYVIPWRTVGDV